MKLNNKDNFEHIPNCPTINEEGEKKLYRCVIKEDLPNSFTPLAAEKPKYKDNCQAWGLSLFKNKKIALQKLKSLSKRKTMNGLAIATINDSSGIKHQSGTDLNHYTFYPSESFICCNEFKIIEDEK